MAETLASRVARVVAGNLHHALDALENAKPEAAMAQSIREVDGIIDEVAVSLGRAAANKHLALSRLAEQNRRHEGLGEEIDTAIRAGRDDLAKAAIGRQLDIEAQIPVLEQAIAQAGAEEKELEAYVAALRAKRREMEETLRQFLASRAIARGPGESPAGGVAASGAQGASLARRLEEAEGAFGRTLARQTGVAEGATGVDVDAAGKLKELGELVRGNRVEERLAALKAASGEGGPAAQ